MNSIRIATSAYRLPRPTAARPLSAAARRAAQAKAAAARGEDFAAGMETALTWLVAAGALLFAAALIRCSLPACQFRLLAANLLDIAAAIAGITTMTGAGTALLDLAGFGRRR